ncbi:MAG: S8 family serine peptidase [Bdellovibrionales bacterium]|nr:S8 family serine peptidase [Bdellovibrionales bacterium]
MFKGILVLLLGISQTAMASIDHMLSLSDETIKDQYIVRLAGPLSSYNMSEVEKTLGVKVIRQISVQSNAVLVESSSQDMMQSLAVSPLVQNVSPNQIVSIQMTPNDPEFGKLWGLYNTGNNDPRGRAGKTGVDIRAMEAWDITTGSKDVVVAIIDTGVDARIADLKNNMWVNEAELNGQPGVDDDGNGFIDDIHGYDFVNKDGDPTDDHGHGSHVAGTIAGEGNNGIDVAGVSWKAQIMGVKFLSASGSGTLADAISAIDYATQMGAMISNNSWGGGGYNAELQAAIERASAANSLFVVAAGNQSNNNDSQAYYPCSYDVKNVLCVASLDSNGTMSDFSNYGAERVDVAAPGRNILSTTPGGLQVFSGTSMATPHVAGAAVLLLSENPGMSPEDIRARIMATSKPNYRLKGKVASGGVLDAYAMLTNQTHPSDPEDPANWNQMDYQVSSSHPYAENAEETYTVEVPNATKFSLYFEKFDTEENYDKVTFKDENGNVIAEWSGTHNNEFSPEVQGTKLIIELKADHTVQRHGFDITKVYYQ